MTGDFSAKLLNSSTYGGPATRDPKFSFKFYANNEQLGQLSKYYVLRCVCTHIGFSRNPPICREYNF